jgi:uncharacterized GH25 family protein
MKRIVYSLLVFLTSIAPLTAHDTWIEAGPLLQPVGEYTYVNLMLGNHGNEHRDFKLASKITLTHCTLSCSSPSGKVVDLKPRIIDMGYAAKEGYWAARYDFAEPGVHEFVHTLDTLHGTIRAVKSAKTYVIAGPSPTSQTESQLGAKSHNLGLELVLETDVNDIAAGKELRLKVLRSGKPLSDARVAFVPRGVVLAEGMDPDHERLSDSQGLVSYKPVQGNVLLAIVHHAEPKEAGEGYTSTHYSAALVLPVRNASVKSTLATR